MQHKCIAGQHFIHVSYHVSQIFSDIDNPYAVHPEQSWLTPVMFHEPRLTF